MELRGGSSPGRASDNGVDPVLPRRDSIRSERFRTGVGPYGLGGRKGTGGTEWEGEGRSLDPENEGNKDLSLSGVG